MTQAPRVVRFVFTPDPTPLNRYCRIECLETRIAPAAIVTPATFTYTDGDGDLVQVTIAGKTGSAEFLDAAGADVRTSGGDVAQIIVTKPSPDFSIAIADINSATGTGLGDNIIELGRVVGANDARVPLMKGIFTADSTPGVSYHLGGVYGTNFSPGGGLSILGDLVGDPVAATTELDLKGLNKGATISFRSVHADASIQIGGILAGRVSVPLLDGALTTGLVTGDIQIGHIGGSLTIQGDLAGRLKLGEPAGAAPGVSEEVSVKGGVLRSGSILSGPELTLHVTKNLDGSVVASSSLDADMGGGMNGARVLGGDDITLEVAGAVVGSSIVAQHSVTVGTTFKRGVSASSVVGGTGLNADVTGIISKSTFSAGTGSMDIVISGNVLGSQFLAGGDASVSTGGLINGSNIFPDGRLTLTTGRPPQGSVQGGGGVFNSVIGSKSTSATVNVGGRIGASQFTAGTDLDLIVGQSAAQSNVYAANDLILEVSTMVTGTKIAAGSDAQVSIGGQLAGSSLFIGNNLDAQIGESGRPLLIGGVVYAGIIASQIKTSDGSLSLNTVGPISKSSIASGQHATVNIADVTGAIFGTTQFAVLAGGSISPDVLLTAPGDVNLSSSGIGKLSPKIVAGHEVSVSATGAFGGTISAAGDVVLGAKSVSVPLGGSVRVGGDLKFVVTGDVVVPLLDVSGNVKDFRVGGRLTGGIKVSGDFIAGTTGAAATVVGGTVAPSTFLQIGGDLGSNASAPQYIFGQGFKGRIEVGGDVLTDLLFKGDVNRIAVVGAIGPATPGGPGDAVADIVVGGRLTSFTSGSLFHTTATNAGQFLNAAGDVTGAIQVDIGLLPVGPFTI